MECAAARPQEKHYLVPIFSFGETMVSHSLPAPAEPILDSLLYAPTHALIKHFVIPQVLDNIRAPRIQRFLTRTLKANVLFMPYGAFNLLGVPRRQQLILGVGKPVSIPPVEAPICAQVRRSSTQ